MKKFTLAASSALALLLSALRMGAVADSENKVAKADAQKNVTITTKMTITIAEQ